MATLFPIEPAWPEGFLYRPDFISEAEEAAWHQAIMPLSLHAFTFQGYEAKRRVASFGYDWNFEKQTLVKGKEIPDVFEPLIQRVAALVGVPYQDFAELLVTEYPVGSVINWHRDAPPFDIVAGLPLLTDCTFRLRPYDKAKQNRKTLLSLPVQRRSLYVLRGAARTDWQHSITAVTQVRYSITLRTLRRTTAFL